MNPSNEFEPRIRELSNLDIIASRQAEWLTEQITPNSSEAQLFCDGLQIEQVHDKNLFCEFPARIRDNGIGSKFTFLYDQPTVDKLVHRYAEAYKLTHDELAEIYIGTGIAAKLLKNQIQDTNVKQMKRLSEILIDGDNLLEEIRANDALPGKVRDEILLGAATCDENRIGRINVMRFAFGMVYERAGGSVDATTSRLRQTPLMLQFKNGLVESIKYKEIYLRMGKIFESMSNNRDEGLVFDGEFAATKVFADITGDFEMAACFPMRWKEIQKILKIVS